MIKKLTRNKEILNMKQCSNKIQDKKKSLNRKTALRWCSKKISNLHIARCNVMSKRSEWEQFNNF